MPKCIGCSRNVGMLFSGKNQKYMATCGDTIKPCDLKIVLHRGDNYNFRDTMEEMINTLEETRANIIQQKMDTLFNYISEDKSAELFKKQLTAFQNISKQVEKNRKMYEDMYFNPQKKEIIQHKKKKIQEIIMEIQDHLNNNEMDEVVKKQNDIKGISQYIQRENYEFMEVWVDSKEDYILEQQPVIYSKLEINHGEYIQVEKE